MLTHGVRAALKAASLSSSFAIWIGVALVCGGGATAQGVKPAFDAPEVVTGPLTRMTNILDLDGDSWMDAVGLWWGINAGEVVIQGWLNDQQGRLAPAWEIPMNLGGQYQIQSYATAVGNLDNDGDDDFVFIIGDDVLVYSSNGVAPPTLWQTWTLGAFAQYGSALALADFNGDGRLDIAINDQGFLRLYKNMGAGAVPAFVLNSTKTMSPSAKELLAVECTGNGTPDLVATLGVNTWIFPVVDGIIRNALPVVTHGIVGEPKTIAGDIDNDGDTDIVVFDMISKYVVERRTGPSTFVPEGLKTGGPVVKFEDLDNDGDLDGICCGSGGTPSAPYNNNPSIFRITYNTGGGNFLPAIEFPGLGSIYIAGATDLDKDGDKDLVAGRCVYYAQKPWGLTSFSAPPFVSVPLTGTHHSDACDIDGDSDPDLKLGLTGAFTNNGNAVLTPASLVMPAAPAGQSYVGPGIRGDFDGDGDIDLLVTLRQGTTGFNFVEMRFLRNTGGGGFVDAAAATNPGVLFNQSNGIDDPRYYLVGDVDGDGDQDVLLRVAMSFFSGSWLTGGSLFINDGTGYFTNGDTFSEAPQAIADFNNDGIRDLLVSGMGDAKTCLRLGLGNGHFGPAVNISSSGGIYLTQNPMLDHFAVADLDADGDIDVSFIHKGYLSSLLVIFRNDGTGVFQIYAPAAGYDVSSTTTGSHVFAEDLDGNGSMELIFSPALGAATVVGVATLVDNVNFVWNSTGFVARTFAMDDFDGDGDVDLLAEWPIPNTTRIVFGNRFGGPDAGVRMQYGSGSPGTAGMTPTLGAKGPFAMGSNVEFRITGGHGGSLALIVLGDTASDVVNSPLPGMTSYCEPWIAHVSISLGGIPGSPGEGAFSAIVPVDPSIAGITAYHQAFIYDPGAPNLITATNGLMLGYGK